MQRTSLINFLYIILDVDCGSETMAFNIMIAPKFTSTDWQEIVWIELDFFWVGVMGTIYRIYRHQKIMTALTLPVDFLWSSTSEFFW